MTELGPDRLQIADDVAAMIGADAVRQVRTDPNWRTRDCWKCGQLADGQAEPIGVVVTVHHGGSFKGIRIAHTRCAPSAVNVVEGDPADAGPSSTAEAADNVTAVAMMWPPGGEDIAPVILLDFGVQVSVLSEAGDLVDLIADEFLARGWELVTRLGRMPGTIPAGTGCVWQLADGADITGPGTFLLGGPDAAGAPHVIVEIAPLYVPEVWTAATMHAERVTALIGPFGLDTWGENGPNYRTLQQAVKSGHVVGALLPIEARMASGQPFPSYVP